MTTENPITISVDGQPVSVPKGTNAVDAAHKAGVEIPIFCHHPRLEPVGMCRMCLVEVGMPAQDPQTKAPVLDEAGQPVIKFGPKLQAGCTTMVAPGMVIRTTTPAVADARKSVLEFLLTSHPLDCPVCDKGGECPLQNLTMRYGPGVSRFTWGEKFRFPKPVPLGPLIALDRERCVLCARCIRFEDEVAADPVLGFENRGRGMEIITFSDPPFQSYFSGNTSDICPVGALTTKDFRFEARAWEVVGQPGICTHCPVGCNVMYDTRHARIQRVMPRENNAVNEIWLCDKGRFAHHFAAAPDRLTTPLVRRDGQLVPATWDEAMTRVVEGLGQVKAAHGANAVGGLTGTGLANEDLYLFGRFMRGAVGTPHLDHRPALLRDDTLARAGAGAGTELTELKAGTTVLAVGLDVEEEAPILFLNLFKGLQRGMKLVLLSGRPQKLDAHADAALRWRYGAEGTLLAALIRGVLAGSGEVGLTNPEPSREGTGQGLEVSGENRAGADELRSSVAAYSVESLSGTHPVAEDVVAAATDVIAKAENLLILYGHEAVTAGLVPGLAALATATGHVGRHSNGLLAVGRHANAQGAGDMGILPGWLPGYEPVAADAIGHNADAMLAGGVNALYVLGTDPAGDDPRHASALEALDFLVVHELFLTPTARLADVVLPAQSAPERDGTFTNLSRRVQRFYPAVDPVGESLPDWKILCELANRMGVAMPYSDAADVFAEIGRTVPGYMGLDYAVLGPPAPPPPTATLLPFAPITEARYVSYEGTAYLNAYGEGAAWPLARLDAIYGIEPVAVIESARSVGDGRTEGELGTTADGRGSVANGSGPAVSAGVANADGGNVAAVQVEAGGPAGDGGTGEDGANPREGAAPAEAVETRGPSPVRMDWRPSDPQPMPDDGQLILVPVTRLYDNGTVVSRSDILQPLVPRPCVEMSPFDAHSRRLGDGAQVTVRGVRGVVGAEVRVRDGVTPGTVLAPRSLEWSQPIESIVDGPTGAVMIEALPGPPPSAGSPGAVPVGAGGFSKPETQGR